MVVKRFQDKAPCNILAHKGFRIAILRATAVANLGKLMTNVANEIKIPWEFTMLIFTVLFLGLKFLGKLPQY